MREDKTKSIYLSVNSQYTRDGIITVIDDLFSKASHLTNPKLVFESTIEPYENFPGDVEVYVEGMRPATEEELEKECKEEEIHKFAESLGVSFYEARLVLDLKNRGKI